MDSEKFAGFIAERRRELGLTQQELAEKLHVTDKAVSRWENGHGFPDINTLEPLADELGISIVELMRSERMSTDEISAEAAGAVLSDTIGIAEKQKEQHRKETAFFTVVIMLILAFFIASLAGFAFWQIWAYNHPEIIVAFGRPASKYMNENGVWVNAEPKAENWHSVPIFSENVRSVFGASKTWKIRMMNMILAANDFEYEASRLSGEEPYLMLGRVDIVDGNTYFTRIGYYTQDGVTKPLYNVQIFEWEVGRIQNLPDNDFEIIWERFPELKTACETHMSPIDFWKSLE